MGQKLDGKAEIDEKIDGNSEMRPPAPPFNYFSLVCYLLSSSSKYTLFYKKVVYKKVVLEWPKL